MGPTGPPQGKNWGTVYCNGMESEDNRVWNEGLAGRWSSVGTDLGTTAVLSSQNLSAWGRVCTLALRWSTVALKWQAAGSLSPLQRRNPTTAIFKGCSELGGGILWKPGSPTLSGSPTSVTVVTDGDPGAQRRQHQVAIVTWMVPTGDWSMQELKCKEAGRTS